MSRNSQEKAVLIRENLLKVLPSGYDVVIGDSVGNPTLTISEDSAWATGDEFAFIRIVQKSYTSFPTISLASSEDGRTHVLQLVLEESASAGISVWSAINLAQLLARLTEQNMDIELYLGANTVRVPQVADITPTLFDGVIRTDTRVVNSGV